MILVEPIYCQERDSMFVWQCTPHAMIDYPKAYYGHKIYSTAYAKGQKGICRPNVIASSVLPRHSESIGPTESFGLDGVVKAMGLLPNCQSARYPSSSLTSLQP